VFISSTFEDLEGERRAVQDLLLSEKYVPVGMETFLGADKTLPEYLKDLIDGCDYYVVIVAGRYGSMNEEGVSWTELEYDYAASTDIPILAFFKKSSQDYADPIKKFRDKIRRKCVPTFWTDKGDLAGKVYRKLIETDTIKPGWVRADQLSADTGALQRLRQAKQDLEKQVKKLNAHTTELEQQLAAAKTQAVAPPPDKSRPEVGKPYRFGKFIWRVLEVQEDRALLLTERIVKQRKYHASDVNTTWEKCELRNYLNGTGSFSGKGFIDGFGPQEQSRILFTNNANLNNPQYGTKGGASTQDKVFLLSIDEAEDYFNNDMERVAKHGSGAWWWWLRSPGSNSYSAASVYIDGSLIMDGDSVHDAEGGVRPALWLNLHS